MPAFFALASGLVFGLGLILSGMADPAKVKAFLDLAGPWDPSLAFVMGGAIAIAAFASRRARGMARSWTGGRMEIPTVSTIDARLIGGGALFGIGWGLGGFCPGPALVALGSGMFDALVFVAAMLAGMLLHDRWAARSAARR
jgi:uncharacterized membrane protein YedE/YeeE